MFSTWKCQSVKVKVPCKILTWSQLTLVTDMLVVKVLPEQDHKPYWMKVEEGKVSRCWQCGTVLKAKYLGEPGMAHH